MAAGPIKVLAVDDEPLLIELFDAALRHRGMEVIGTSDAKEAARMAVEAQVDLVILDVHMPRINGFEILAELRARASMPVLFVSGDRRLLDRCSGPIEEPWQREIAAGTAAFLFKPFSVDTLFEKVDLLLGRERAPNEN